MSPLTQNGGHIQIHEILNKGIDGGCDLEWLLMSLSSLLVELSGSAEGVVMVTAHWDVLLNALNELGPVIRHQA